MADIRVSIGHPYEVVYEDRRVATEDYVQYLRTLGHNAELEVIEYQPDKRGLGFVEVTLIYIALKVGDAAIGSVVNDVYESAKRFIRLRYEEKKKEGRGGRPLGFTIYDQEREQIASWDTREDDPPRSIESEDDEADE